MNSYVLIGFMASGKTTVGKELSRQSGLPLIDLDQCIEDAAGMPITEIFRTEGEEGFRRRETEVLKSLVREKEAGAPPCIYSTGGGIIVKQENHDLLKRLGLVVYLRILPQTVIKRTGHDTKRPLLQGEDREQKVRTLMEARKEAYEGCADIIMDCDDYWADDIAEMILSHG